VGIAIGLFVLAMALLVSLGAMRRKRIQRQNLAYIHQQQQHPQGTPYPAGYDYTQSYAQPQQAYPQYPPQTYDGYGGQQGYAQPYNTVRPVNFHISELLLNLAFLGPVTTSAWIPCVCTACWTTACEPCHQRGWRIREMKAF